MAEISPALASLLNMSTIMTPLQPAPSGPPENNSPFSGDAAALMPSFALGGMVGPGGTPIRPNIPGMPGVADASAATPMNGMGPQQMELEARRFVQQNPQQVAQIREAVQEALADGDITMDQVQILTNMAKVALQNPEMYPQLRQSVAAQGIIEADELPDQFDQGTMFVFLLIGQILQSAPAGPGPAVAGGGVQQTAPAAAPGGDQSMMAGVQPPMSQMQPPMASMARGGSLPPRSPNPDGSIPINAHEGEYVIPSRGSRARRPAFFDKRVQSYTETKKSGNIG